MSPPEKKRTKSDEWPDSPLKKSQSHRQLKQVMISDYFESEKENEEPSIQRFESPPSVAEWNHDMTERQSRTTPFLPLNILEEPAVRSYRRSVSVHMPRPLRFFPSAALQQFAPQPASQSATFNQTEVESLKNIAPTEFPVPPSEREAMMAVTVCPAIFDKDIPGKWPPVPCSSSMTEFSSADPLNSPDHSGFGLPTSESVTVALPAPSEGEGPPGGQSPISIHRRTLKDITSEECQSFVDDFRYRHLFALKVPGPIYKKRVSKLAAESRYGFTDHAATRILKYYEHQMRKKLPINFDNLRDINDYNKARKPELEQKVLLMLDITYGIASLRQMEEMYPRIDPEGKTISRSTISSVVARLKDEGRFPIGPKLTVDEKKKIRKKLVALEVF